jgi:tRNA-dihydrouridine synthase A
VLNGGVASLDEALTHLEFADGVMLGRAAYKSPAILGDAGRVLFSDSEDPPAPSQVLRRMQAYAGGELEAGARLSSITRHMTGLLNGMPGARRFRRLLTEDSVKPGAGLEVLEAAIEAAEETELKSRLHSASLPGEQPPPPLPVKNAASHLLPA